MLDVPLVQPVTIFHKVPLEFEPLHAHKTGDSGSEHRKLRLPNGRIVIDISCPVPEEWMHHKTEIIRHHSTQNSAHTSGEPPRRESRKWTRSKKRGGQGTKLRRKHKKGQITSRRGQKRRITWRRGHDRPTSYFAHVLGKPTLKNSSLSLYVACDFVCSSSHGTAMMSV